MTCHGVVRVLLGWQWQGERAAAGVPWSFGVAVLQCTHSGVAGALVTGREGAGGCERAAAFSGARRTCDVEVGEWQWAGADPQWRACHGVLGVAAVRCPHGGVVGAGGGRRACCGVCEAAAAGRRRVSAAVVGMPRHGRGNGGAGERQWACCCIVRVAVLRWHWRGCVCGCVGSVCVCFGLRLRVNYC